MQIPSHLMKILKTDRYARTVFIYAFFLIFVTAAFVAAHLRAEQKALYDEKERALRQLTQTIAEHVVRTFDGADQTLRYVRREYLEWRYVGTLTKITEDANAVTRLFKQIAIADERGRMIATSIPTPAEELAKVNLSDRPHFKFHQSVADDIPRVGEPLVGRVSKQASIQLSRRISDSTGNFKGMIVTSVSPEYFSAFFQKIVADENGDLGVTLFGEDGVVRARASAGSSDYGQKITGGLVEFLKSSPLSSGTFAGVSSIDQKQKLFFFQRIPEYRLVVTVWANIDSIDRAWWDYLTPYLIFETLLVLIVVIGYGFFLLSRARQIEYVDRLLSREKALEQANAFQARMISSVSHELRTPLTSILGYGGLIEQGDANEETREFGAIICRSAEHLKNVINGILDLSRKEAGKLSVALEPVEIRPVLQRSTELFRVNAESKGLALKLEIDPLVPAFLRLDRTKFVQVVENLLSNAIKFTNAGQVSLAARVAGDGKRIEFSVQDSGIGVPAPDLGRLFEPFYSVKDEQHKKQRGAGLGLNIVKEFTELMGGTAAVESEVGKGTTFTVSFPV